MRFKAIHIEGKSPISHFDVTNLSDAVFIGGPNGVGKTRLLSSLITFLRKPTSSDQLYVIIEATNPTERKEWQKGYLDTRNPTDCGTLTTMLKKNRFRSQWKSGIVYFESDRTIQRVEPLTFTWDLPDPDNESISWDITLSGLRNRWQDTLHTIFRRIEHRRRRLADRGEALLTAGASEMPLDGFDDPLDPFRDVFYQLLRPKTLLRANVKKQTLHYALDGRELDIATLSSGEREVLNMAFDFVEREPHDCIILFDEPELHLHSELAQALVQTLRSIGSRNQFLFCTHSPDLIASGLDNTVVFLGRSTDKHENQAILVEEDDQTNAALQRLGHSIGIISLGRQIVLVEGNTASLDKKVYDAIIRVGFPEFVLVPSEGKSVITNFATLQEKLLSKTIWGVEFFMLCDQDAAPVAPAAGMGGRQGRLKTLERYHLENYFLDEIVWAQVFNAIALEKEELLSPDGVRATLLGMAERMTSYVTALYVASAVRESIGNVDVMPRKCDGLSIDDLVALFRAAAAREYGRMGAGLDEDVVSREAENTYNSLRESLGSELWRKKIPGRPILNMLANRAGLKAAQLKMLYIKEAEESAQNPFEEIKRIFTEFREQSVL